MDQDNQAKDQNQSQTGGDNIDQPTDAAELAAAQANAADLIRRKLDSLYEEEPSAAEEAADAIEASTPRSKHQQYMYDLSRSGKSLAGIQSAWHEYYANLPDKEKHEVWKEFYASSGQAIPQIQDDRSASPQEHERAVKPSPPAKPKKPIGRTVKDIRQRILGSAKTDKKLKARQHFQSILFGLSMGSLVILVLLFGLFNERFIAPFITPSKNVSSTPIIADSGAGAPNGLPKVIIPKINVEIPVVYDEPSIQENALQKALERGVVHYATTSRPGEKGNTVIFGHSSNNIFNPGKYKFAFVLLSRLDKGDLFYLTKDSKRYAYRVYKKSIVNPSDLSVLGNAGKPATATLITCDPPGTSLHRLVVVGEQISPDPLKNKPSPVKSKTGQPKVLPSNAPSLWERLLNWLND